jgi:hypothetical protein
VGAGRDNATYDSSPSGLSEALTLHMSWGDSEEVSEWLSAFPETIPQNAIWAGNGARLRLEYLNGEKKSWGRDSFIFIFILFLQAWLVHGCPSVDSKNGRWGTELSHASGSGFFPRNLAPMSSFNQLTTLVLCD